MLKYFITFMVVIGTFASAYADFTIPEQVNQRTNELQANRDGDTPWGIAVDDSNVHFVFESRDPFTGGNSLDIHYRVLNFINWDWEDEETVTKDEIFPSNPDYQYYGHPSIVFDKDVVGLISYCKDNTTPYPPALVAEMRTRDLDFYGSPQFGTYRFMSNDGGKYAYGYPGADAVKTPVMALGADTVIYGFWMYPDTVGQTVYKHIYYNEYDFGSWGTEDRHEIYGSYNTYQANSICALDDPNGNIHIVMGLKLTPSNESIEVYHCWLDVSTGYWTDLELVSELSEPDGYDSTLPYLAFRKIASGYKMYVVWQDFDPESQENVIIIRIYDSVTEIWDTETLIYNSRVGSPCVAALINGDIYVVWDDYIDNLRWIYYKVYDYSNSTWSSLQTLTGNEDLDGLYIPTIIRDKWDNLHLSALGSVDSLPSSAKSEVFYSFYDAPPHIRNLTFLQNQSNQDSVVIDWEGMNEPDLDAYKVYRKYGDGQWQFAGSTTNTRYADTSVSYSVLCGDNIITKYYVQALDDAE
jgi:hypothetical protein